MAHPPGTSARPAERLPCLPQLLRRCRRMHADELRLKRALVQEVRVICCCCCGFCRCHCHRFRPFLLAAWLHAWAAAQRAAAMEQGALPLLTLGKRAYAAVQLARWSGAAPSAALLPATCITRWHSLPRHSGAIRYTRGAAAASAGAACGAAQHRARQGGRHFIRGGSHSRAAAAVMLAQHRQQPGCLHVESQLPVHPFTLNWYIASLRVEK